MQHRRPFADCMIDVLCALYAQLNGTVFGKRACARYHAGFSRELFGIFVATVAFGGANSLNKRLARLPRPIGVHLEIFRCNSRVTNRSASEIIFVEFPMSLIVQRATSKWSIWRVDGCM